MNENQEKQELINIANETIDFVIEHGRFPRAAVRIKKKSVPPNKQTREERAEIILRMAWERSKFINIVEAYTGTPIESVPEEYQNVIAKFRSQGLGITNEEYDEMRANTPLKQILSRARAAKEYSEARNKTIKQLERECIIRLRTLQNKPCFDESSDLNK